MIYQKKEFILKNGTKLLLKSPGVSDARMLINQIVTAASQTDYLLSTPEDFEKYLKDISKEEDFIAKFNDSKDYLICAYVDGKIVGNLSFKFLKHTKAKHRATVSIAIIKEYWGLGIGSIMFDEMINIAKNTPGIEQIELDGGVIAQNERAMSLYKKKGFIKTGTIPHELKLSDGTYLDGCLMTLFLND